MKNNLPLPANKKLTVNYKMEPGCLGPDGPSLIEAYCQFAQRQITDLDRDFVNWVIQPRFDKNLAEITYEVNGRELRPTMVEKYLAVFDRNLDEFEEQFNDKLMKYIDQFLNR